MPLTIIPMVINLISGVAIWQTELPTITKVIITVLIILKYAAFFYGALVAETDSAAKYISLGSCAALNIGILIYTIVVSQWTVTIGIALTLILLIIWSLPMLYIFKKEEGNEQ